MLIISTIFIIFNTWLVCGLYVVPSEPGILMEKYGKIVPIENYLHVSIKFNFSAFHIDELYKLVSSTEKLCEKIENKFDEEHPLCQDVVQANEVYLKKIIEKYGYLLKLCTTPDINSVGNEENFENNFEFTADISKDLSRKIEHLSKMLKHITSKISDKTSNKLAVKGIELNQMMISLSFNFQSLRGYYNEKLNEIEGILNDAENKEFNSQLFSDGFVEMLMSIGGHQYIIDLNKMDMTDFKILGKISVYKEGNTRSIILSLPLTTKEGSYELIQLRPIPKLENNILTSIKLETKFIVWSKNNNESYGQLENLSNCKFYDKKYFCENLSFIYKSSNSCISQILKNHHKNNLNDFSMVSSCKLSSLKIFGNIAIKLHEKNSYLTIITKDVFLSKKDFLKIIPKGVYFINDNNFGILKIDGIELNFQKDFHAASKFQVMSKVHSYNYSTPKVDTIIETDVTNIRKIFSTKMSTFEELYELSTDAECLNEQYKQKMYLYILSSLIFILLIITLVITVCDMKMQLKFEKVMIKRLENCNNIRPISL